MVAVIAVANQKGGVGKTASAVNLAHGAARKGMRVCLIDLDAQGNVADSLGMEAGHELVDWLANGIAFHRCAVPSRENLWVVRSDKSTVGLKTSLAADGEGRYAIADSMENHHGFDLVIFDCAPSLDTLHTAALVAADWLIVPTRLDQFAVKGVMEILKTLAAVNRRGDACQLAGIVPTFYDRQTLETQKQLENLAASFGNRLWPMIPQDSKIRSANRAGKTLWEYAPSCRAVTGVPGIGGGYTSVLENLFSLIR